MKKKLFNIGFAFVMALVVTFIFAIVLNYLYPGADISILATEKSSLRTILFACIFAPFMEEFFWRWAPITLMRHNKNWDKTKWAFVVIVSFLFGVWHGDYSNVYQQGVVGFFLGWVYIKNNYSYLSSVFLHMCWNFLILVVGPLLN